MTLATIEIGSLPKLPGRLEKVRGNNISEQQEKVLWETNDIVGGSLATITREYLALVHEPGKPTREQYQQIVDSNAQYNLKLLEAIGITYVWDGEARRKEMYDGVVQHVAGIEPLDQQISFVNLQGFPNTFVPFGYRSHLLLKDGPLHTEELNFVQEHALHHVKIPITGSYTLATWTDPGPLKWEYRRKGLRGMDAERKARAILVEDFSKQVIQPSLVALAALKPSRIQIDEPNATAYPDQISLFARSLKLSLKDHNPAVQYGLHVCFSEDYGLIADAVAQTPLSFLTLELANIDTGDHQSYRDVLEKFERAGYRGVYCIGVCNVHKDEIESASLIRERALAAIDIVGKERVELAPDCGLRTRVLPIAARKLIEIVDAARSL